MKYETHSSTPKQINPALKAAALEAARCLTLAAALGDLADITGRTFRGNTTVTEAILQLSDEMKAKAVQTMTTYTTTKGETK